MTETDTDIIFDDLLVCCACGRLGYVGVGKKDMLIQINLRTRKIKKAVCQTCFSNHQTAKEVFSRG